MEKENFCVGRIAVKGALRPWSVKDYPLIICTCYKFSCSESWNTSSDSVSDRVVSSALLAFVDASFYFECSIG